MKNIEIKYIILISFVAVVIAFIIGTKLSGSPHKHSQECDHNQSQVQEGQEWTCSMHPQIREDEPGLCPICAMDLIPVSKDEGGEVSDDVIRLSNRDIVLGQVATDVIKQKNLEKEIPVQGEIVINRQREFTQTAHFDLRIEKLLKNYEGSSVRKNEKIATVYAPDLAVSQQERKLLGSIDSTLNNLARKRLENRKILANEVDHVFSQHTGVITDVFVSEGDYVKKGAPLFKVADINSVWAEFHVYQRDLQYIKVGDSLYIKGDGIKDFIRAKISFIEPFSSTTSRTTKIRAVINRGNLPVGAWLTATIKATNISPKRMLAVAKEAVLWTGETSIVFIKQEQTETGVSFRATDVVLGDRFGNYFVVESGLEEGDEVVTHGAFVVDASAQLAYRKSMMNRDGTGGGGGHDHAHGEMDDNMQSPTQQNHKNVSVDGLSSNELKAYLNFKDGFVESSVSLASSSADELKSAVVSQGNFDSETIDELSGYLDNIVDGSDIDEMRADFEKVSDIFIAAAKSAQSIPKHLYIQFCPMAFGNKGAYWLSDSENILNPYFGDAMLTCGELRGEIPVL